MQLSHAELETAQCINELVSTCPDFETFNTRALPRVSKFLDADSAMVMRAPASFERRHRSEVMALENIQRNHIDIYVEEFCDLDPYIKYSTNVLDRTPGYVSDNIFKKSDCSALMRKMVEEFDREFLRYTGIKDVICFPAAKEARTGDNVVFGVHRHNESDEFSNRTFLKARILFPVLTAVLSRCALNHSYSILERMRLSSVDDQLQTMALLFDECGRLVGSTDQFNDLSLETSDLLIEQVQAQIEAIQEANTKSTLFEFSPPAETHISPSASVSLDVLLSAGMSEGKRPCYIATIRQSRVARLRRVASLWSLTARETEIVCALFDGQNNKTIAVRLGISPKTVENHMTSIFLKSGSQSRTELVSKVFQ